MKHTKKLLALLLTMAMLLALVIPASAAQKASPLTQALKRMNSKMGGMGDCYVYPYGGTFDATVVKGSSVTLQFKRDKTTPGGNSDYFYAVILKGSLDDVDDYTEVMDERFYPMSEFNNSASSLGMSWKADSDYPAGDYSLICFVVDSDYNMYDQVYYGIDLHVVKGSSPAKELNVYTVDEGHFYFGAPDVIALGETVRLLPNLYPLACTDKRDFKVSVSEPSILDAKVDCGFVLLTAKGYGFSDVTISCGKLKYVISELVVGFPDQVRLTQGKESLCVGQTDTIVAECVPNKPAVPMWSSSNPSVVTVKNGVVTAVGPGTATVHAYLGVWDATVTYTVHQHKLSADATITERTATSPRAAVGYCSLCGNDKAMNIYEPAIFPDTVAGSWYAEAVDYVYDEGLMNGVAEGRFNPSGSVTRAQLVTILYRVAGEPAVEFKGTFGDVPAGKWYSDAVEWAAANDIVTGISAGRFAPMNVITREQIATILYRYIGSPDVEVNLGAFPDGDTTSNYAKKAMTWAISVGLINGIKSGSVTNLAPHSTATRAQIASIIMRFNSLPENLVCEHAFVSEALEVTCNSDGGTKYTCTKCGDSYLDDVVPALGHDFVDGKCTRCGTIEAT